MDNKVNFQRHFLIFNQEDGGFGSGQEPSGYVKIEVREGKGKLFASVQNLREDLGRLVYKLYILNWDEKQINPVLAGVIPLQRNRGEMQWEFNAGNVAATGIPIDKFSTAVVLVEYKDRDNLQIVCPLAAYKGSKIIWRDKLKERLYPPKSKDEKKEPGEEKKETVKEAAKAVKEQIVIEEKVNVKSTETVMPEEKPGDIVKRSEVYSEHESGIESIYKGAEPVPDVNLLEVKKEIADSMTKEEIHTDNKDMDDISPSFDEYRKLLEKSINEELYGKNEEKLGGCIFNGNAACPSIAAGTDVNPCAVCRSQNMASQAANTDKSAGNNPDNLRKLMDRYFEASDPFGSKRRDYRWWKVNSPVYLNNILYQCNIRTPLLFNPVVITAHFKYRHLITGIYTDKSGDREYIVCGIPGVYGIDDKPFGEMCRWVQLEGSKPRYGAFGYWLVYIDPKTGKFLPLN